MKSWVAAHFHWLTDTATGVLGSVAMAPINALAAQMQDAVSSLLENLGTVWIKLDTPNVWSQTGGTSPTVQFLHSEVAPLVGIFAVGGIVIGACRLAWGQRYQQGQSLVEGILILVLVTGCGVPFMGMLVSGADAWSQSIIDGATQGSDFSRNLGMMLTPAGALAPVLVVFFGIVALLVSAAQIVLMIGRAALLVLMAGLLPAVAATTTTQSGRAQMRRYLVWVIALTAYKPIAALIYATAFQLLGTHSLDGAGAAQVLIGLTTMTMAVLALPALMRFLVPATAALHAGGAGMATAAVAGQMPSGAKMLRHMHPATAAGVTVASAARGPSGARNPGGSSDRQPGSATPR